MSFGRYFCSRRIRFVRLRCLGMCCVAMLACFRGLGGLGFLLRWLVSVFCAMAGKKRQRWRFLELIFARLAGSLPWRVIETLFVEFGTEVSEKAGSC